MKKTNNLRPFLAALAYCGISIAGARADYTAIADHFSSDNFYLPVQPQFGFTVYQGQLYSWNSSTNWGYGNYSIVNLATNRVVYQSADAKLDGNGYGDPFGFYDPDTDTFYAGTYAASGTGMWRFNNGDETWTKIGVFDSLYGVDSYQGRIYASGLNQIWNGTSGQDNQIALYDLSGGGQHDVLIQAIGNSANCAVDKYGNVYYANYGNLTGVPSGLYVWSSAMVDSVCADLGNGGTGGGEDDIYLTYSQGLFLTELPGGANGLTVDEAGNVFVSVNGADFSGIVMWNTLLGAGSEEDPGHYLEIAGISYGFGWSGFLDAAGNVLDGGTLYAGSTMMGSDFSILTYDGEAITPPSINDLFNTVPEPGTWALLLIGAAALVITSKLNWKKTRNSSALPLIALLAFGSVCTASAQEIEDPIDPNPGTGSFSPGQGGPIEEQYFPDAGVAGFVGAAGIGVAATTTNGNYVNPAFLGWATGVVSYTPSDIVGTYGQNGIGSQFANPNLALGPVTGNNMDTVTLGDMNLAELAAYAANPAGATYKPGELVLSFDEAIRNGAGADFAAFENGFVSNYDTGGGSGRGEMFAELGFVEVSTDGEHWARFPSIYNNFLDAIREGRTDSSIDVDGDGTKTSTAYLTQDVSNIYNLVGKHANAYATSFGTPFDLDDLADHPLVLDGTVDLNNIRYVKIVDIPGDGTFTDSQGNPIYDAWVTWGSGGLDFEALGVINYAGITLDSSWDNTTNFDARAFVDANTTLGIDVIAGALQFNGGHRLEGGSVTLGEDNRGIAVVGEGAIATLASDLAGEDGFTKSGAGTLVFEGAKSYTGETIVQEGTLKGRVPALARDITSQTGGNVELVVETSDTYSNVISGAGGLLVSGEPGGILTLGAAQTYTGSTEVKNGTLRYGLTNAISSASRINLENGADLDLNGHFSSLHSLDGAGRVLLGGATLTFVTASGASASFAGDISGAGNLVMDGAGTQTLSGVSDFTGGVQLKQGTLAVNSDAALGDAANAIQFSGGILQIDGTEMLRTDRALNVDAGGELKLKVAEATHTFHLDSGLGGDMSLRIYGPGTTWLSGENTYTGVTTVESGVLKGSVATLSRDITNKGTVELVAGTADTFSNVISGAGGLRISGAADSVLTLTTAQTYTGKTDVQAGTLRLGSAERIADGSVVAVASGARFDMDGKAETIKALDGAGEVALGGATLTLKPASATAGTFSGAITGNGNLVINASSTTANYAQILSGASTFTGSVVLQAGYLGITSNAALGNASNAISFNGGTLRIDGTEMHSINRTFTVANGGELKLSVADVSNSFNLDQNLSGNFTLGLYGAGVFTLSGTNTNSGGIKLGGGILEITDQAQLGSGTLTLSGGRLRIAGTGISTLTHNIASTTTISLDIADAGHTYTAGTEAVGTNATRMINKYGEGTLVYAAGTTRTGNNQIYEGTLDVRTSSALGGTVSAYNNSTLILRNGVTTAKSVTATNTASILMEGTASATSTFTLSGTATATLKDTASAAGAKTLNDGSSMTLRNSAALSGTTTLNAQSALHLEDNATLAGTVTLNNTSLLHLNGQSSSSASVTLKNTGMILLESGASLGGSLNIQGGTLGGTGTVRTDATFVSNSILAPGQSTGTLDFENVTLTLQTGATYLFEIDASGSDLIRGSGTNDSLILEDGGILEIVSLDGTNPFDTWWSLFSGFETITGSLEHWTILYGGQTVDAEFSQQSGEVTLRAAEAVPEPSTCLLLLAGAAAFWIYRKAKKRRAIS